MILKSKHYCQYTYCYLTIKLPCITDKFPRYGILYRILLQCTGYVLDDLAVFHLRYLCVWYRVNHLNPVGNAVIGLDLVRALDLVLPDENLPWISAGVFARDCMDLLEKMDAEK